MNKKIALIGAGNVASHLAPALLKAGLNLCQIYSRTPESARELGKKTGISYTTEVSTIYPDCDIYIFCVKDDALVNLFRHVRINKEALILHTSGSLPMDVFKPFMKHYGVLYPLQTFTKRRELDFREIPLCVEASDPETLAEVKTLAGMLSARVEEINSERRKVLHLAAVFANNFVNHMYGIAGQILEKEGLDFSLLRPLIFETAHKVMVLPPEAAQTGPARRRDETILGMHKNLLKDDRKLLNLYNLMSDSIREEVMKAEEQKNEGEEKARMLTLW